jgi:hypothetical protein
MKINILSKFVYQLCSSSTIVQMQLKGNNRNRLNFKAFHKVTGHGIGKAELLQAVSRNFSLSETACKMIQEDGYLSLDRPYRADLVVLTPADFGITERPRTDQFLDENFLKRWSKHNLDGQLISLCHPEDGPHLGLQYDNSSRDEIIIIGSKPLVDNSGSPHMFVLERDRYGEGWLYTDRVRCDHQWRLAVRIALRISEAN